MCLIYYLDDFVFECVFGDMLENYLIDLGWVFDLVVEIFWIGCKVVFLDYLVEYF